MGISLVRLPHRPTSCLVPCERVHYDGGILRDGILIGSISTNSIKFLICTSVVLRTSRDHATIFDSFREDKIFIECLSEK